MGVFANKYDGPSAGELAAMAAAQADVIRAQAMARNEYAGRMAMQNPQNIAMEREKQRLANTGARAEIGNTDARTALTNTQNQWFGPTALSNINQNNAQASLLGEQAKGVWHDNRTELGANGQPQLTDFSSYRPMYGAPSGGQMPPRGLNDRFGWEGAPPPSPASSVMSPPRRRMSLSSLPGASLMGQQMATPLPASGTQPLGDLGNLRGWLTGPSLGQTSDQSRNAFFGGVGNYRPEIFKGDWG